MMFKYESLCNKLNRGEFIITAEISTPKGADISKTIEEARKLKGICRCFKYNRLSYGKHEDEPYSLGASLAESLKY